MLRKKILSRDANNSRFMTKNIYKNHVYISNDDFMWSQKYLSRNLRFATSISIINNEDMTPIHCKKILETLKYGKKLAKVSFDSVVHHINTKEIFIYLKKCPKVLIESYRTFTTLFDSSVHLSQKDSKYIWKYGFFSEDCENLSIPFRNFPKYYSIYGKHIFHKKNHYQRSKNLKKLFIDLWTNKSQWELDYGLREKMQYINKINELQSFNIHVASISDEIYQYIIKNLPITNHLNHIKCLFQHQSNTMSIKNKLVQLKKYIKSVNSIEISSKNDNIYDFRIFGAFLQFFDSAQKLQNLSIKFRNYSNDVTMYFDFLSNIFKKYRDMKTLTLSVDNYQPSKKINRIILKNSKIEQFKLCLRNRCPPNLSQQIKIAKEIRNYINALKRFGCFRHFRLETKSPWTSDFYKLIGQEIECYQGLDKVEFGGFNNCQQDIDESPFLHWKTLEILCCVSMHFEINNENQKLNITDKFFYGIEGLKNGFIISISITQRKNHSLNSLKIFYQSIIAACQQSNQINNLMINQISIKIFAKCWQYDHNEISKQTYQEHAFEFLPKNFDWIFTDIYTYDN